VHTLVLLMMGIMMPETCWDKSLIINIRLVASCWPLSLHPTIWYTFTYISKYPIASVVRAKVGNTSETFVNIYRLQDVTPQKTVPCIVSTWMSRIRSYCRWHHTRDLVQDHSTQACSINGEQPKAVLHTCDFDYIRN